MARRLSTAETAARLGVARETVYAYVSRGVLHPELADDGRSSTFSADEVDAYRRARRGKRERSDLDTTVVSSLTRIDDHRIYYRELDALAAARAGEPFEAIAAHLWNHTAEITAAPDVIARCHHVQRRLPDHSPVIDRQRINVAVASACDPLRDDRSHTTAVRSAGSAIAAMVDGLVPQRATARHASVADRLLARLGEPRRTTRWRAATNAALVLLADHDLAASTLAARVAASTRTDPYGVIAAGLGALTGPLHGTASAIAARLLRDALSRGAAAAVADALRSTALTGWGHALYPNGDPRAIVLFDYVADAAASHRAVTVVEDVGAMVADRVGQQPNIDFALGAFCALAELPDDSGAALFATARSAGWIAHALEEYEEAPLRFRPRARYVR